MAARTAASGGPVSEAQEAVSALRAFGWAHPTGAAAIQELWEQLWIPQRDERGADAQVEAALAALDAGALPLLADAVRESARAVGDRDEAALKACSQACGVIEGLLEHTCETTPVVVAAASAPTWRSAADALAEALVTHGSLSAELADTACRALVTLCVRGAWLGSDELAAAASRGAAEALAAHASSKELLHVTRHAAMLAHVLLQVTPEWPLTRVASAAAAFFAADGLEALFTALDAPCDDNTLDSLPAAILAAVYVAPSELVACLSASGECYGTLTRALRRTSLPPDVRWSCLTAAHFMAGQDATAHAHLARSGLLDASAATCLERFDMASGDADARNDLVNACAHVITLAAQNGSVPADLGAALRALSQVAMAGTGKPAVSCCAALTWLCKCPGAADVASAVGVPAMMLAALGACGGSPSGCTCKDALMVLDICADEVPHDVLRTGAVSAAVRALQSHARHGHVESAACMLLVTLTKACKFDAVDAIGAADGWRPLVAALREHGTGDAILASNACSVLTAGATWLDSRNAAAAAGAIPAITAAMHAHTSHAQVQQSGMLALGGFGFVDVELDSLRATARAVVAGMARYAADVEVQRAACFALVALCLHDRSASSPPRTANAVIAVGTPAALLAALRTHAGDEVFMSNAPRALGGLMIADSWPPDGATWLDCRAALVAHIAAHGCPVWSGEADTVTLRLAAKSLAETTSREGPAPPGAEAVLCLALREALKLQAAASDERRNRESEFIELTLSAGVALARFASAPGAAGEAFSAEAFTAGAVELLAAAAANAAQPDDCGDTELRWNSACASALHALVELTVRLPAAACRAAACGVHSLANACMRANAFAGEKRDHVSAAVLESRLRKLVKVHEDGRGCAVPDCDLLLMSKCRCCLHDCDAAADAPLKLCGSCRRAAYCCAAHQRQAWPRHKAVCKARAAVEAACARLQAHAKAARGDADV